MFEITTSLKINAWGQKNLPIFIRKAWSKINGYFWLPCPTCGEMFSGCEAGTAIKIDSKSDLVSDGNKVGELSKGKVSCSICSLTYFENKNSN